MQALGYLVNEQSSVSILVKGNHVLFPNVCMPLRLNVPHHLRITAHPQQNKFFYIILI